MKANLLIALSVLSLLTGICRAEADTDRLIKQFNTSKGDDNAAGANALLAVLAETCGKILSSNQITFRRPLELLAVDVLEALGKMGSAEAQKAFANGLSRLPPYAQANLLFGLKSAPANADLDAAALKVLTSTNDPQVKVGALELLAAHKHYAAVDKTIQLLNVNEVLPVQIAACRTLGLLPDRKSVPALASFMQAVKAKNMSNRPLYEATAALRALTGAKFNADASSWRDWWAKNEATYKIDDPAKIPAPIFNYELSDQSDLSYYEIPLFETRLVFLLDVSGSMQFGGTPNRLDKARDEMKNIINRLCDKQFFNIVAFSIETERFQPSTPLVAATQQMKTAASKFLDSLKPKTGTMTSSAMEEALRQVAAATACETIFLVTDGGPSPWIFKRDITFEQQQRHISWMNMPVKTRINTIGIYTRVGNEKLNENVEEMRKFLQNIAAHNDGLYKEIGKQ
jgi:hypothetical protein